MKTRILIATCEQVWGLEITTASRAAFLVQLTTVIVPVLEAVAGQRKLKAQVRRSLDTNHLLFAHLADLVHLDYLAPLARHTAQHMK